MPRPLLPLILASGLLTGALAACFSTSGDDTVSTSDTLLTVYPTTFAGNVVCSNGPNAWRTYVATLTDVTRPDNPVRLPSSPPISCFLPVSFARVVPGHAYTTDIEAYDRADIIPAEPGSAVMLDAATKQQVLPRWQTSCGQNTQVSLDPDGGLLYGPERGATLCEEYIESRVRDCSALHAVQEDPPSGIVINLSKIQGSLACGTQTGQIDHFRVVPTTPGLATVQQSCGTEAQYSPVAAGYSYRFRVEAFDSQLPDATWATNCSAIAKTGVTVPALCDPLSQDGAARVDVTSIVQSAGRSCGPSDVDRFRATVVGSGIPSVLQVCEDPAVITPLPKGTYQIVVDALALDGSTLLSAWCEASVSPSTTVDAVCHLAP